jgi:uncharacterized protein involved in tolerance to divalent cations
MISLRISSNSERKIEQIAHLLITKKLILDAEINRNMERIVLEDDQLVSSKRVELRGKTKAILFTKIDELIRSLYLNDLPEIYSIPIVHMDWEQAKHLTEQIEST